ncbi:hypothetical protein [Microbacterium amylolyticum]|uniref:Transcriptional regulator, AbiEi antitoxin, Type IV TA system n=1 Tax=Microbacterium amylolyticum TaxID=936337 RepID=A0ABS4ZKC8_9MICO|nr:hypothetical protein [Microbacterium amylolyticum]MBP2437744.1 hypothetical protein [Microbacterium amylolyticum]
MTFSFTDPPVSLLRPPIPLVARKHPGRRYDAAVERGDLLRIRSGIYVDRSDWKELPRWERYLMRVHAVAAKLPQAVFTFESAAVLMGLPVVGDFHTVHLLTTKHGTAGRRGDLQYHFFTDDREAITVSGIAMTPPGDTAIDIARVRHPAYALAVADTVVRDVGTSPSALLETNDQRSSRRGRGTAMWPLANATPLAESPLESMSRAVCEWLGFPSPELQVPFHVPGVGEVRVDNYWREYDIIGEADGRQKYAKSGTAGLDALWSEKNREDGLRQSVKGFARWGWDHLRRTTKLEDVLLRAGLPRVNEQKPLPLRSLAALL